MVLESDKPLPPLEQQTREEFHQYIYKRGGYIPEGFVEDKVDMRVLATHGKDFEESYEAMHEYEKLLIEKQQYLFSRISQLESVNAGIYYGYMRDMSYRPIQIFNLRKSVDMGFETMEDFLDIVDAIALYTNAHALVPGQIETYTFILDFKDLYLSEWPVSQLFYLVTRMRASYKLRTHKLIAVNVHWLIAAASNVIFTFLPKPGSEKIMIFSNNGAEELLKFIEPNHLE